MEQFSAEFRMTLANLIRLWKEEKGEYDELHITPMTVLLEAPDRMTSVELEAVENPLTTNVILQRCVQDLAQSVSDNYRVPAYVSIPEDERLPKLVRMIRQSDFKRRTTNDRLEIYYYLGQILAFRGWSKADMRTLWQDFRNRTVWDVKKMAKRTFELFQLRGVSSILTLTFIKPTYLLRMSEGNFYGRLLPEVERLNRQNSLPSQ